MYRSASGLEGILEGHFDVQQGEKVRWNCGATVECTEV